MQDAMAGGTVEMHTRPGLGCGKAADGKLETRGNDRQDDSAVGDEVKCPGDHRLVVLSQQLLDRPPCQLDGLRCKSCRRSRDASICSPCSCIVFPAHQLTPIGKCISLHTHDDIVI